MPGLILPSRFTKQPKHVTKIAPEWASKRVLSASPDMQSFVGLRTTLSGTAAKAFYPEQGGIQGVSVASGSYYSLDNAQRPAEYTLLAIARTTHRFSPYKRIIEYDDIGSNRILQWYIGNYQCVYIPFDSGGTPYFPTNIATDVIITNGLSNLVVSVARGTSSGGDLFALGSKTSASFANLRGLGQTLKIAESYDEGFIGYAVFGSALSDAEIYALIDNPWQVFSAPPKLFFFSSGGVANDSLTASNISSSAPTLGTPLLAQDHVLSASNIAATATLGTPAVSQDHVLTATGISATATLGTPLILGDAYSLTATGISSTATLGTPVLTQNHVLTANGVTASSPTLGTTAITQDHVLTATGISTTPTLGTPIITGDAYSLTATGISATATLGTPALTQNHVLTATGIASTATLGTPLLSGDTYLLTAISISATPTLGTPALSQNHVLGAGAIAAGPPTFGSPTLAQQHALMASGITAGYPVLGSPVVGDGSVPELSTNGLFDGLSETLLDVFGSDATLGTTIVRGVLDESPANEFGIVGGNSPRFRMLTENLPADPRLVTLKYGSRVFAVRDWVNDGNGLTYLQLEL